MSFEGFNSIQIENKGAISEEFLKLELTNLGDALRYIQNLDYGRNSDKENRLLVLQEQRGTCGTKHATLYELIKEQGYSNWELFLGVYIIDSENTEEAEDLLLDSGVFECPNAHVYLKYNGETIDATKKDSDKLQFRSRLVKEEQIEAEQISDYKKEYLITFMKDWYKESELSCSHPYQYVLDLRERIIQKLSV